MRRLAVAIGLLFGMTAGRARADTASAPDRYFSYRRTTLAGGGPFGTQASAIRLV